MASSKHLFLFLISILFLLTLSSAEDAFVPYNFEVSYITASPLGVPQQVIAINDQFPGPTINVTTNNNVAVNVRNKLDESLLIHRAGIQQRRSSWQDGVLGTNCPIPPKWNWTYQFQVKDQIGSFFYFPSPHFQRAAGGFGGCIINTTMFLPSIHNLLFRTTPQQHHGTRKYTTTQQHCSISQHFLFHHPQQNTPFQNRYKPPSPSTFIYHNTEHQLVTFPQAVSSCFHNLPPTSVHRTPSTSQQPSSSDPLPPCCYTAIAPSTLF